MWKKEKRKNRARERTGILALLILCFSFPIFFPWDFERWGQGLPCMLYLLGLDLWTSRTAGLPDLTCLSIGELIPHSSFIDIRYAPLSTWSWQTNICVWLLGITEVYHSDLSMTSSWPLPSLSCARSLFVPLALEQKKLYLGGKVSLSLIPSTRLWGSSEGSQWGGGV